MSFRTDLPYLDIPPHSWESFDYGDETEILIPDEWNEYPNVQSGDIIEWVYDQLFGTARIIGIPGSSIAVKKIA